jgi:DNA-directed RNA polymerase subunit RPC12/RpoP
MELDLFEIDSLLSFLRQNYSGVLQRIWQEGSKTLAVFIHEEYVWRTSSNQTITVILEYDAQDGRCKLVVVASGGRSGLLQLDWGSQGSAESTFMKAVEQFKRNMSKVQIRCSACGQTYSYPPLTQRMGILRCQNCGHVLSVAGTEAL